MGSELRQGTVLAGVLLRLRRLPGLWSHPDFVSLWGASTLAHFGSQVTLLALPLLAVLTLEASAGQMGLLRAIALAPFLLLGLAVGTWADRWQRRPILMWANLGRAVLLGLIPAAALLGFLSIGFLYLMAFLVGVLMVFHDVAYHSYLPTLVKREQLVEGNSKLAASGSAALVLGPGVAGVLVEAFTPPMAIIATAFSFALAALFLLQIRAREPAPIRVPEERGMRKEVGEGLRLVLLNPVLRTLAASMGTLNLFANVQLAILVLYLNRELGLAPALVGALFSLVGVGGLVGSLLAPRLARRYGPGRTILGAQLVSGFGAVCVPLAGGPATTLILAGGALLFGWGLLVYNIAQVSLRQAITPDGLQGRMNATMRVVLMGVMSLGALLGGLLGEAIGLRTALAAGALGMLLASLWVVFSPLRTMGREPELAAHLVRDMPAGGEQVRGRD